jgi:hypothetical protein
MFPTPEQNARLKACRTPEEYDREWERVTQENISKMESQSAAEIRALREQEYDLWLTNRQSQRQRDPATQYEPGRTPKWENPVDTHIAQRELERSRPSNIPTKVVTVDANNTIMIMATAMFIVSTIALLVAAII